MLRGPAVGRPPARLGSRVGGSASGVHLNAAVGWPARGRRLPLGPARAGPARRARDAAAALLQARAVAGGDVQSGGTSSGAADSAAASAAAPTPAAADPQQQQQQQQPSSIGPDPEARFGRFGRHFGGRFWLSDLVESAPRVRVRTSASRARAELLELAVLNERLAGTTEPWEARARLEVLRNRRRAWDAVYDLVNASDAAATLEVIEEAAQLVRVEWVEQRGGAQKGAEQTGAWCSECSHVYIFLTRTLQNNANANQPNTPPTALQHKKADELLSEDGAERTSVGDLRRQLTELQGQVEAASEKLAATQARVDANLARVERLKAEAAALERARGAASAAHASEAPVVAAAAAATTATTTVTAGVSTAAVDAAPTPGEAAAAAATVARAAKARRSGRGLASSLEAEPALKNFWYPVQFTSKLAADTMVPFELFDEPWVLFRDAAGRAACVRDECAHRACPLSLGRVVGGEVECAYHGWRFDGAGTCTAMPSTVHCRGVRVSALPCVEKDGFVWVWPGEAAPGEVPATTMPPEGYDIHAEIELEVPVEHGE